MIPAPAAAVAAVHEPIARVPDMLLAWIPFIHPLNIFHDWWWLLLVPLSFGIAVIYKAVRMPDLQSFWRQVSALTLQIVLAMIALAVVVIVLVQVVIPWLAAE